MKTNKIIFIFTFLVFAGFLFWSCTKSTNSYGNTGGNNPGGNNNPDSVSIYNISYNPSSTTVKVGTTVTWVNNDPVNHTVTSDDGKSFNSGILSPGSKFTFTPDSAGTYTYHCNIHSSMKGKLTVTQ